MKQLKGIRCFALGVLILVSTASIEAGFIRNKEGYDWLKMLNLSSFRFAQSDGIYATSDECINLRCELVGNPLVLNTSVRKNLYEIALDKGLFSFGSGKNCEVSRATAVPEPTSLALFVIGLAFMAAMGYIRKVRKN